MKKPTELKAGDRCPNCGGEFVAAPTPTPEQRQKAGDRENPEQLPPHFDSATDLQREQLGALFKCSSCGYKTRLPLQAKPAAGSSRQAGAGDDEVDKQRRDQAEQDERTRRERDQRDRDWEDEQRRKRDDEDRKRREREDSERGRRDDNQGARS